MMTLGFGEIFLLLISVIMVAFFFFALIAQPHKEQNKTELYHSVTTQMGDRIYTETKIIKGSFANEICKDQAVFTPELHLQNLGFVQPSRNLCLVNNTQPGSITGASQQNFYNNNLYSALGGRDRYLEGQTNNQAGNIYEVV